MIDEVHLGETMIGSDGVPFEAEALLSDYRMTPATQAFKLENREVGPNQPLRWIPKPHLMYISLRIAQAIAKGNGRIIISAPPRHGKSKLCTVHGPLWVLENYPTYQTAVVTYGADLSTDFARETRDYITRNGGLLNVKLREDATRLDNFLTESGGSLRSIGIDGPFTGRGAHVLFVDDYIKTIKEALSPGYRQDVYEWFTLTAMQRLEPNATVVIIATRWHHDDLIGRLIKEYPDDWEYISIPAIALKDDVLGRKPGEPLFPERYGLTALESRRKYFGTAFFDAIYQQKPHDGSGQFAKREWLNIVDAMPMGQYRFTRIWDFAGTQGGGDYTVGTLLAKHIQTQDVYICNVVRGQWSSYKVEQKVQEVAEVDGTNVSIGIEQEPGSAGKALIDHFKANVLQGFRVKALSTNKHKLIRAQPFLAGCEGGRVKLLKAPWNKAWLDEFDYFPDGENDDQIDTAAMGWEELCGKARLPGTWGRQIVKATAEDMKMILRRQRQDLPITQTQGKSVIRRATFGRFK